MGCVPDSCTPQSVEEELAIAHCAIAEGDLGHAAFHIAAALIIQPSDEQALAVFDGWFTAADDPLRLVAERADEKWEGWVAMRALTPGCASPASNPKRV